MSHLTNYANATLTPHEERTWATVTHVVPLVAMILSAGTLGFVASLIIFLIYKDRGPFVRAAAANSLNVQIMTLIVLAVTAIIWFPLLIIGVGYLIYGAILLVSGALHLIGALKANKGEWYNPAMTPRIIK